MKTKLLAFSLAISLMLSCVPAYATGEVATETPPAETGEVTAKPGESTSPEETEQPKETDPSETEQPKETEPSETEEPKETEPSETEEPKETEPSETEEPEKTVPPLTTEPHVAYINGTGDGQVSPEGKMTRAETAQILYNLASSKELGELETSFSDVSEEEWYYTAIQYLASWDVIHGDGDGTFRPEGEVTRAEFVTMLSAYFELEEGTISFSDVPETYWGYAYIASAFAKGWINGYKDGTFRPDQEITRAEAIHVMNAVLNRTASQSKEKINAEALRPYWDLDTTEWYYYDVIEATVSHEYSYETGTEVWTSYTVPDCGYDAGWVIIGSYLYHVSDNLQFDQYEEGYQTINGATYYVNSNGQISTLRTDSHVTYINGKGGGRVDPDGSMTRAEAAQIIYTMSSCKEMGSKSVTFSDVSENSWYYTAVQTLASWNAIRGYEDGTFQPERAVSRAEFITMLSTYFDLAGGSANFTDLPETHWAYSVIASAVARGWITGYGDGTVRPDRNITRAEAMHIMNLALNRTASHSKELIAAAGIRQFWDLNINKWYYYDVLEATVSHEYSYSAGYEVWTSYTMPDSGYTPGWVTISDYLYHVNASLQFDSYSHGLQTIEGAVYYVNSDGLIPVLSAGLQTIEGAVYYVNGQSQIVMLSAGIQTIEGAVYYVNSQSQIVWLPKGLQTIEGAVYYVNGQSQIVMLPAGLQTIEGAVYYVNSQSQIVWIPAGIQTIEGAVYYVNNQCQIVWLPKGLQTIDGAVYYVNGQSQIELRSEGFQNFDGKVYYVNSKGQIPTLAKGLQEVNGELVYVQADGSLLANASYNYLWFGADGCYTSGSDELDALVDAALAKCTNSSMTQSEKLRAAYLWVRDNNRYLSRSHHSRGSTDWTVESATFMLTNNRGNCYCFASTFLYMARRLGYDTAYPVSGGVGYKNSDHAWVMITQSNGVNYIYDVELEYAYLYRYGNHVYYNLYQMKRGNTPFVYHFPK